MKIKKVKFEFPLPPILRGFSGTSPLKIMEDVYMKTLLSKIKKIYHFDHFCLNKPLTLSRLPSNIRLAQK